MWLKVFMNATSVWIWKRDIVTTHTQSRYTWFFLHSSLFLSLNMYFDVWRWVLNRKLFSFTLFCSLFSWNSILFTANKHNCSLAETIQFELVFFHISISYNNKSYKIHNHCALDDRILKTKGRKCDSFHAMNSDMMMDGNEIMEQETKHDLSTSN